VLSVLDRKWREHLYEMDYLREGIGLRAYSQRDPLVEYQREGFELFGAMMEGIAEESVGFLFNLDVQVEHDHSAEEAEAMQLSAKGLGVKSSPQALSYSAPSEDGDVEVHGETVEEDTPESEARRVANVKNRARQKAKQQRKSRKNNR
jgi:preprotein translocase subunit SecA